MPRRTRCCATALGLLLLVGLPLGASAQLSVQLVAGGLDRPLFLTAPRGDTRLFVVERDGRVVIVEGGVVNATPFLDIEDQVDTSGERGLLGLAFPEDYADTGFFYVYYTDNDGDSVLSRFSVSAADPDVADPAETVLLTLGQPADNHNGGTIAFGLDGFLLVGLGDGGGGNAAAAQDPQDLLGKMLRLDVGVPFAPGSTPVAGTGYAIPADNPFVGDPGTRDEIWALGLRNPYRWSANALTGNLWIADVGQSAREEVDLEPYALRGGHNYGWPVFEGDRCNSSAAACAALAATAPVHVYDHSGGNCSITGGYAYRGSQIPSIWGLYFFGDFCTGRIWSYDPHTDSATERTVELAPAGGANFQLVGFGEDGAGELYIVLQGGSIYRILGPPGCGQGALALIWLPPVVALARRRRR